MHADKKSPGRLDKSRNAPLTYKGFVTWHFIPSQPVVSYQGYKSAFPFSSFFSPFFYMIIQRNYTWGTNIQIGEKELTVSSEQS